MDKKITPNVEKKLSTLELDEMYWFIREKSTKETRENVYIMTMVSRSPRQIVGFDVAFDKTPERIHNIVDSAPPAKTYCTDGWLGYIDVVYPGKYIRNVNDKSNTFTVEVVNADLRHYIPILRRRSRCFARKIETLRCVLEVFIQAYNAFGEAKRLYRAKSISDFRELQFSVLDFL